MIAGRDGMIATTLPGAGAETLPARGEVEVAGSTRRLIGFDGPGFDGGRVTVRLLSEAEGGGLSKAALEVLAILIAALIAAFAFAITVVALPAVADPARC